MESLLPKSARPSLGHPVLTGTIEYSGHSRLNASRISHSGLLEALDLRLTLCRRGAAGRHRDVGRIDGVTEVTVWL